MAHAIVITGMHRSGTSLTSSLLQHAGVNIGEKLLPATSANPRGFFEDVDFYEYHESLLHQRGQTYLRIDNNFTFQPTDSETERARQLIAERSHRPFWGWKDPRTSLFLDFWHQLLPDGRFLFVYRNPIEVLLSLLRRGDVDRYPSLMTGLNAWYTYNSNILTFSSGMRIAASLHTLTASSKKAQGFLSCFRISCNSIPGSIRMQWLEFITQRSCRKRLSRQN